MVQESRCPDLLTSGTLGKMDSFLAFLRRTSVLRCIKVDSTADLLFCAFPLDSLFGVLCSGGCSMVGLDFEVFLLVGICQSR
jgi:hypothetical protein